MFLFQDTLIKISKNEGILSLWSGLSPTLILAVPATIAYFVSYEQLRLHFKVNEVLQNFARSLFFICKCYS